jgi:3-oxoacyl-[acyl-carrier-protein] synthase II
MQKDRHAAHLEPLTFEKGREIVGKPMQRHGVRGQAVITGMGVLSPIGNSCDVVLDSLKNARSGIDLIRRCDTSHFRTPYGGEIKGFDAGEYLSADEIAEYEDLYLQRAISAARQALKQADIHLEPGKIRRDIALVLGTCNGGLLSAEDEYRWKHGKSQRAFDEKMNLQAQYYGFGKAMAAALGIGGDVWIVTTACSSTTGAIGLARMLISRGYYDTVIVGGSDSLCVANMAGFDGLKATSTTRTSPFSMPVGLNVGEAACFWVVEEMEKAIVRNARCLGRIAGHATTCDAYHPTSPDPRGDGVYRTLRNALSDAQLELKDIGCVNAHGTGTEANDRAESKGVARFIENQPVPVVSTKSFFGHCMGTAGILEATCNLLSMNAGFIPPTINFSDPRPGCGLDYVPNTARNADYHAFVSANYAFGGNNAAVVITSWDIPSVPVKKEPCRVVITGTGTVTSIGLGIKPTLEALSKNICGIGDAASLNLDGMRSKKAGLVPDFRGADVNRRIDFGTMNKISRMATAAASFAIDDAGIKITPRNTESFGIAMGVCNGPPETAHMDSVFKTDSFTPDINCFSNITANSTAGWVANALGLKGVNTTLSPGPHAGLQCIAYAYDAIADGRAKCILAGAADEVYAQTYFNYDLMKFLYEGGAEENYCCDMREDKRKVLGEGAAVLAVESLEEAQARNARILAELLGYSMPADAGPFSGQNMGTEGLTFAVNQALERSNIAASQIDLVVWAPQGNAQDKKVIDSLVSVFGEAFKDIPMVTSVFNTGYIESASILVSLGAVLNSIKNNLPIWPQRTGLPDIDSCVLAKTPGHILALAGTGLGYNFAAVLKVI